MAPKNRTDLKSYFVKNAIPTEGNFADLIDSQLNQAEDGVFKLEGEPLSLVAAPGDQKRVLKLYANYPANNPDWMISLNPAIAGTSRSGFGVTDGAGKPRLFIDATTGLIGVGTNKPEFGLDVVGGVRASGFHVRGDMALDDYRTVNLTSNVCLHAPAPDRDAWIYRDSNNSGGNRGIYHRQIGTEVSGLPGNSIAFVGGDNSKLQAYVGLKDGSAWFAGKLTAALGVHAEGNGGVVNIEGSDHAYIQWYPMKVTSGRKGWIGYGERNTEILSVKNEVGELRLVGKSVRVVGELKIDSTAELGWARSAENFNAPLRSGLYEYQAPVGRVPDESHDWVHMIAVRHSNASNNKQLQIASSHAENGRLFFRKIDRALTDTGRPEWNELATVTNGVLKIGDWALEAEGEYLYIKRGAAIVARFATGGPDRLRVFRSVDGLAPFFYYNKDGGYGQYASPPPPTP